jgi:hypothetical protein
MIVRHECNKIMMLCYRLRCCNVLITLHSRWCFQDRESFDTMKINFDIENNSLFSLINDMSEEKNLYDVMQSEQINFSKLQRECSS